MNDIYAKTQKLMDDFLDSVSDEEFFADYLALERFNGPLAKDFLQEDLPFESNYTVVAQSLDLEFALQARMNGWHIHIHSGKIQSDAYGSLYAENLGSALLEGMNSYHIYPKEIQSHTYDPLYVANDENYSYGLAA